MSPTHEAGWAHAEGALRGPGWLRPPDDTNALVQHDIAFHRLVVEAAGNSVLEQCWKSLGVESRITISLYGTYMAPELAAERHIKLLDAIRSGNASAAGREARKHVEVSAKLMRAHLKSADR